MDLNGKFTRNMPTNKKVRQSILISLTLFNIYIDDIFRIWKLQVDSQIQLQQGILLNSLLYADKKVIIRTREDKYFTDKSSVCT